MANIGLQETSERKRYYMRNLRESEFRKISEMIYELCGINLHDGKKELVQARLNKRLNLLGLDSYGDYIKYVECDESGEELTKMVDSLSTNVTYFFRESDHFDFLSNRVLAKFNAEKERQRKFRVWCAGCSSGEEAYTIAMTLRENLSRVDSVDALILASDISTRVLTAAREARYGLAKFKETPAVLRERYFDSEGIGDKRVFTAKQSLRSMVRFAYLNLTEPWPMKGQFDVIFCRNVMIYFDHKTQAELVNRFYGILKPGGYFFTGHSESLTGISHKFNFVRPSIYLKK